MSRTNTGTRKPGFSAEYRSKIRALKHKKDARKDAELRELRKAVGKRKLKEIKNKLKKKRLTHKRKSQKTKKNKTNIGMRMAMKTKKFQRGGDCNISTVNVPGFSVGPLSYSGSDPAIEGISVGPRRGAVYKSCTNGGKAPNHAFNRN